MNARMRASNFPPPALYPLSALPVLAALCLVAALPAGAQATGDGQTSAAPLRRCSLDEYRQHLEALRTIVAACSAQRTAAACNPAQVGPDNEVVTPGGLRQVHYDWLRTTLREAGGVKDAAGAKAVTGNAPASEPEPVSARLSAAAGRLAEDAQASPASAMPVDSVRKNLNAVLAEHEFQRIGRPPNLLQQAERALLQWIIERLSSVAAYGGRNPWIARLLEVTAISVPCIMLLWWAMVRMRRQAALQSAPEPPAPSVPSAREWQRWMQEAEAFAQQQRWREAVHHVYWAAISRLEGHGLWPADRARTPREYLALLRADHLLQPDLRGLTRSFERIWYGHRPAEEKQYREARAWMERLVPR